MTRTCARCWQVVPEKKPRRSRLYCSPRCRRLAEYDRRRVERVARRRQWRHELDELLLDTDERQEGL